MTLILFAFSDVSLTWVFKCFIYSWAFSRSNLTFRTSSCSSWILQIKNDFQSNRNNKHVITPIKKLPILLSITQLSCFERKQTFYLPTAAGQIRMDRQAAAQGKLMQRREVWAHQSASSDVWKEYCASFHLWTSSWKTDCYTMFETAKMTTIASSVLLNSLFRTGVNICPRDGISLPQSICK